MKLRERLVATSGKAPLKTDTPQREAIPDGKTEVHESIMYLRNKCEPLRGRNGAIAAYHVLNLLDWLQQTHKLDTKIKKRRRKRK